jgi:hypothetical protein
MVVRPIRSPRQSSFAATSRGCELLIESRSAGFIPAQVASSRSGFILVETCKTLDTMQLLEA